MSNTFKRLIFYSFFGTAIFAFLVFGRIIMLIILPGRPSWGELVVFAVLWPTLFFLVLFIVLWIKEVFKG